MPWLMSTRLTIRSSGGVRWMNRHSGPKRVGRLVRSSTRLVFFVRRRFAADRRISAIGASASLVMQGQRRLRRLRYIVVFEITHPDLR